MIELLILIAALFVVAGLAKHAIDWLTQRRWDELHAIDWDDVRFRYSSEFALRRPSAHAILTGITS